MRPLAPLLLPRTDGWLWVTVALLVPLGVLMVHSAALVSATAPSGLMPEAARQATYAVVGVIAMVGAARLDYRLLQRYWVLVYALAVLLLFAVLVAGVAEHGARRWLGVGGFALQPSEFAKLALAVALAAYGAARHPRLAAVIAAFGLTALLAALVLLQPDLGTVVVLGGVVLLFLVGWGIPARVLLALAVVGVSLVPMALAGVPAYQRERLAVFVDPERDPLGSGFNLRQIELALGTSGVTGHGLFSGAQSHLDAVAARSSDFMFGFVGAELGLAGALLLLALLALITWRGLRAARRAPDPFGRLLAVGVTGIVLVQALVNVSVNLRMFPATGIPLPFISQGGSSLVVMLVAVGLLQSVASRRPPTGHEQWHAEHSL
jgi:rod shape determining protein RodA